MILALRTDKPLAELYLISDNKTKDKLVWEAHRQLSVTLLDKIDELLNRNKITKVDLDGLIVFEGPGSFTGLRIGISVINALAYSLQIPNTGARGETWIEQGITALAKISKPITVLPHYGAEAHITQPKK